MKHKTLAMLTMLVCAAGALAVAAAPTPESGGPPGVGRFDAFVGDWDCSGQVFAHGAVQAHATRARAHGEQAAGGRWVLFRYDEVKTAVNPKPFHIDQYFGYDLAAKQFVSVAVDTVGHFSETAPGWSGDTITFDEVADGKVVGHDTFTLDGRDGISHSGADRNEAGEWIKTDEETCRRI